MIHGQNDFFFNSCQNEVFHESWFKYCTYFDYFANATNFTITANIMRSTISNNVLLNNAKQGMGLYSPSIFLINAKINNFRSHASLELRTNYCKCLKSTTLSKVKILNAVQSLYAMVQSFYSIWRKEYIFMNFFFNFKEFPDPHPQTKTNEEIGPSIEIPI